MVKKVSKLRDEFEESTGLMPMLLQMEGVMSLFNIERNSQFSDLRIKLIELSEYTFNLKNLNRMSLDKDA